MKHLLFIDNHSNFLASRTAALRQNGFAVTTGTSAEDALSLVKSHSFDLAILDIRLVDDKDEEDRSGLNLARRLDPALPIIMLTGYERWETVREALLPNQNGKPLANDYIMKNEGPEALIQAIKLQLFGPEFRERVLVEIQAASVSALPQRARELGAEETSRIIAGSWAETQDEKARERLQLRKSAQRFSRIGQVMGILGFLVFLITVFFSFTDNIASEKLLAAVATALISFAALYLRQADKLHNRVENSLEDMDGLGKWVSLFALADLTNPDVEQNELVYAVLTHLLNRTGEEE